MSLRPLWVSVVASLLSCRELPRKPEPAAEVTAPAQAAEVTAPAQAAAVTAPAPTIEVAPPDPDNDLAGVFPPVWNLGDHWRVTMVTPNEASMRMIGYDFPVKYGYVVYEFHVAEVPADDAGFYRLIAVSIRAEDSQELGFHVFYRKKPFSFERVVEMDRAGKPSQPVWRQYPDEGPLPEMREQNRFIGDFPIMPEPPHLGQTMYALSGITPRVQLVERTADGLRFTLEPGCTDRAGIVMDWKRGAKWWSSLGRYSRHREAPCETFFNGTGLLLE